jgi:hypothetical protein
MTKIFLVVIMRNNIHRAFKNRRKAEFWCDDMLNDGIPLYWTWLRSVCYGSKPEDERHTTLCIIKEVELY